MNRSYSKTNKNYILASKRKDEIIELLKTNISLKKVCEILGLKYSPTQRFCFDNDIKSNIGKSNPTSAYYKISQNKNTIIEMIGCGYSLRDICEQLNLPYGTAYRYAREHNIQLLKNGTGKKYKALKNDKRVYKIDKDTLEELYLNQKLSIGDIEKQLSINRAIIHARLREFNIPTRNYSESGKLIWTDERRDNIRKLANDGIIGVNLQKQRGYRGNTNIEKSFIRWCQKNNVSFKQQQQIYSGGHQYDFLLEGNILVETDGVYWHNRDGQKERDVKQEQEAAALGYTILRFTDKEIKKTNGDCFDRLFEFIK